MRSNSEVDGIEFDLNTLTNTGIYRIANAGVINSPMTWGVLLVLRANIYILQIIFSSNQAFFRFKHDTNNRWYDWNQFSTTSV